MPKGFGIGTSKRRIRSAAPAFSPASLFAAGEQGIWLDPSDLSTMFQDSAGTTPVTAAGQPVGLIRDKSGRGNHLSQATASARPTLQQDATGYYLAFDGSDDNLLSGAVALGSSVDALIGVQRSASRLVLAYPATASGSFFAVADPAGGGAVAHSGAGSPTYVVDGVTVPGAPSTLRTQLDAALSANARHVLEAQGLNLSTGWSAFGFGAYSTWQLNGRIYGVLLAPSMTEANRAKARTWMAQKAGLSL